MAENTGEVIFPERDQLETTKVEVRNNGVAIVTLHRPARLNAFNGQMAKEIQDIFLWIRREDRIRAVVVTGNGKSFCVGADLKEINFHERASETDPTEYRDSGGQTTLSIFHCRKPVVAAINGDAVGIGITMTLPMAVRVVSEDARIGFVFTKRGVSPEACSSWFLPRIVGISKALEWVSTARIFKAKDEERSLLFNYVVKKEQVLSKALEIASEMAESAPVPVSLSNSLLWHGLAVPDPQATHLIESKLFAWLSAQDDCQEGMFSFAQKRPATFSGSVSKNIPPFYPWWTETEIRSKL